MTNGEKYKGAEEREKAFNRFCDSMSLCAKCPVVTPGRMNKVICMLKWLDLEAKKEKQDNCPYCGNETYKGYILNAHGYAVQCKCGYSSSIQVSMNEAIARHNELCRKVKGEGK